jgi:hypothetical protein
MKNLFLITALILASFQVQADQIDDARAQAIETINQYGTSSGDYAKQRVKQAQATLRALNGQAEPQQQAPAQVNIPPQYIPSIGQWCQVVNGVQNCWK